MRILPLFAFATMSACGITVGGYGTDAFQDVPAADASFASILNNYRATVGAQAVQFDSRLNDAAQAHAEALIANKSYYDALPTSELHFSVNGDSVTDRVLAEGYDPMTIGENIAGRQTTEDEVMTAWENSPSHDEVLTETSFQDFGLGLAVGDESRWVLVMGSEKP